MAKCKDGTPSERSIQRSIQFNLNKQPGVRVFKNDVGMATLDNGSKIRYGLRPGSSDLIGWTSKEITPEMVGNMVAVFTAVEVKKPGGKGASDNQKIFIRNVIDAGGIAGIARSVDEAKELIKGEE